MIRLSEVMAGMTAAAGNSKVKSLRTELIAEKVYNHTLSLLENSKHVSTYPISFQSEKVITLRESLENSTVIS